MAQQRSALRALHYRSHSWGQHRLSDRLRRRRRRWQAAVQDNPSRLSSQRKGQQHTRERLCTTCTVPSPPLGSLSNTTRSILLLVPPPPQQGQLPLLCVPWLPYSLMEEKMKNETCLSVLVSLQDTTALGQVLLLGASGAISQKHNSSTSSRTKSHHIWTVEYNQISLLDFRPWFRVHSHLITALRQKGARKAVKAEKRW